MQKARERGVKLHFNLVDFKSEFYTIWIKALRKMMRAIGISKKAVNIIENMYNKIVCSVVIDGYQTGWFESRVGVRQGFLLSPTLCNLFFCFCYAKV